MKTLFLTLMVSLFLGLTLRAQNQKNIESVKEVSRKQMPIKF